jgi:lysophospholipase L1-like esterase
MLRLDRATLLPLCFARLALAMFGAEPAPAPTPNAATVTLMIAGDSTAANGVPAAVGWGRSAGDYFDRGRVIVDSRAIGGRSARTFVTEGR